MSDKMYTQPAVHVKDFIAFNRSAIADGPKTENAASLRESIQAQVLWATSTIRKDTANIFLIGST